MPKFMLTLKPRQLTAVFLYILSLPAFLLSLSAHADENDAFNVVAGIAQQHDDNLFRETSAVHSDAITSAYAGIRLDKLYSLQRFKLDYTLTSYKYQANNYLDFDANEYKAAWLWALTPYLTGTLSASKSQSLYGFLDYNYNKNRNISTVTNRNFEADLSPHGNWHFLAGFTQFGVLNTQVLAPDFSFTQGGLDVGLKYVFSSGSSIALKGHDRKGSFESATLDPVNFYDTGFNEREGEVTLDWRLSGKSNLSARAAYVSRENDHFSVRDYSGVVGRANYDWTPSGKLRISVTASRDLASFQTVNSNYTRNDILSVSPIYSISSKIKVKANASVSERTFVSDNGIPSNGRVDSSKSAGVSVDWAPYRSVSFGANIQRSSRSSTLVGYDFKDTTAGLSANLYF